MKLQIISNRLPVKIEKEKDGFNISPTCGGLATGLSSLRDSYDLVWTGWSGSHPKTKGEKKEIESLMGDQNLLPVWLSEDDYDNYYKGFSNKVIWPLFHYFCQSTECKETYWESYVRVNQAFCDRLLENASEDDIFWVHDYHLMLLPQMIRERLPNAKIGFFLHIPFPHYEVFKQLPWCKEILEGIGGADLVGFHTAEYTDYFLNSVKHILDKDIIVNNDLHSFVLKGHRVNVGHFPMGIDYEKFARQAKNEVVQKKSQEFKEEYKYQQIILSVDRLDYTKGIVQRLKAFDLFLENNPEYRGKISLLELIVPSRADVEQYKELKKEIDEYSGKINGLYGTPFWTPVRYFYRSVDFDTLCAMYLCADVALITPIRDGMNLVSKEYVAVHQDRTGVLILSEFAGASIQLKDAVTVNPYDRKGMAGAIKEALNMSEKEKIIRLKNMQQVLQKTNVNLWSELFIQELKYCSEAKELSFNFDINLEERMAIA